MNVTVKTHANIALLKYWGKRDKTLFLPTKNSFSIALDALTTTTNIAFSQNSDHSVTINKMIPEKETIAPIISFLDYIRHSFSIHHYFTISTHNNFPMGAGIASSASGFAALALGINDLCTLGLSKKELSVVARHGSGSASRSVFGGFVWWHKGNHPSGNDSFAQEIVDHTHWPELRVLVVITNAQRKAVSSRYGMDQTVKTSSYYRQWIAESTQSEQLFIDAVMHKDFRRLGILTEKEWDGFHQSIISTIPRLCYWNDESYNIINHVKKLRAEGVDCFFTTDAGPQVKIFCLDSNIGAIQQSIRSHFPTVEIIESRIAPHPTVSKYEKNKSTCRLF